MLRAHIAVLTVNGHVTAALSGRVRRGQTLTGHTGVLGTWIPVITRFVGLTTTLDINVLTRAVDALVLSTHVAILAISR